MRPLFAHQQRALDFLRDLPVAAVLAGLGTGKTRIILEDAQAKGAALVVVCPKTAIVVWQEEIERWHHALPVYLINYERVWREPRQDGVNRHLSDWIRQHHTLPLMVALDESHKIKNRTAKQSKGCRKLGRLATYRRILSGTPVLNGHHDLWAQFTFLLHDRPDVSDIWRTWRRFAEDHVIFSPLFPGKVEGIRNLPVIQRQLAPFTFHVRTEDVLDLPPETTLVRTCELGQEGRRVYNALEKRLCAEIDEHTILAANTPVKLLRLAEVTGGFVHSDADVSGASEVVQVDHAKLDLFRDVVEEIGQEKFVVFVRFTAERLAISKMLTNMGIVTVSLHGSQDSRTRAGALAEFRSTAQALVSMIQVGSASIDLTSSRVVIYYSLGWSFGDYAQSRGRIRRQGQIRSQIYVHLVARKTIDEVIFSAVAKKKQTVAEAVQTWWQAAHENWADH